MAVYTNKNRNSKQTNSKTIPIVLLCLSSILFINLLFNLLPFINSFMLGVFGLMYYVLCAGAIAILSLSIAGKHITASKKEIWLFVLWLFFFVVLVHLATSHKLLDNSGYGQYIANCYKYKYTAGGVLFSLISYVIPYLTHIVAGYVANAIALVILTALIIEHYVSSKQMTAIISAKSTVESEEKAENDLAENNSAVDDEDDIFVKDEVVEDSQPQKVDDNKEKAKILLGLKKLSESEENEQRKIVSNDNEDDGVYNYSKARKAGVSTKNYILTQSTYEDIARSNNRKVTKINHTEDNAQELNAQKQTKRLSERDAKNLEFLRASTGYFSSQDEKDKDVYDENLTLKDFDENRPSYISKINQVDEAYDNLKSNNPFEFEESEIDFTPVQESNDVKSIDEYISAREQHTNNEDKYEPEFKASPYTMEAKDDVIVEAKTPTQVEITPIKQTPTKHEPKYRKPSKYMRPPLDLLKTIPQDDMQVTEEEEDRGRMIEDALANFKITANISSIIKGPAFTRYELTIPAGQGISVKRIGQYQDDIAMSIQSKGNIRLLLPIAGKNAFGVEVPNDKVSAVGLKELLESYNYQKSTHPLTFALGKDITSECIVSNLEKCVHILLAGTTGSGKSVCAHTIILSLMYKTSPDELKFLLIDPKKVEFTKYANLPHMLIPKPITDPQKAVEALDWVCREMDRRYQILSERGVRNIYEYNKTPEVQSGIAEKMYFIVVVVDELSDLMMRASKEVEDKIIRISQLARSAGVHLIISTQRPSADVVTGTIKSNLPTKIALAVANSINSRIIIDEVGAENLLGRGDMLFSLQGSELQRIQGAYVSDEEIDRFVEYIKDNNETIFDETVEDQMFNKNNNGGFNAEGPTGNDSFDPLVKDAVRMAIKTQYVSPSNLQRKYKIGWNRAASIVDQMVAAGFISEPDSKHKYTIFITEQEFEEKFGEDFE